MSYRFGLAGLPVASVAPVRAGGALLLSLAVAVAVLTPVSGCRGSGDTSPEGEAGTTDAGGAVIAGPCAQPALLGVGPDSGSDVWAPVTVTERTTCFSMRAEAEDATGVYTDTAFVFESAVELSPEDLARILSVEPAATFRVEPMGTSHRPWLAAPVHAEESPPETAEALQYSYRVVLDEPLDSGQLYRFRLADALSPQDVDGDSEEAVGPDAAGGDASTAEAAISPGAAVARTLAEWGFQTRERLRVVQTLPGDASADVPLDAGIEITFSHADTVGVEDSFTIEPAVDGSFETRQRTVVFIPDELAPTTLYTVRIEDGVGVAGSDLTMDAPHELRFETGVDLRADSGEPDGLQLAYTRLVWEQPTGETPTLSVLAYGPAEEYSGAEVDVTAYRYPDMAAFASDLDARAAIPQWARQSVDEHRADTDALEASAQFVATLEPLGEYGEYLLRFPEPLDPGAYLVETELDDGLYQAWLQVTDIATYVALSEPQLLVWVNDVATGGPVEGAEVMAAAVAGASAIGAGESRSGSTDGSGGASTDGSGSEQLVTGPDGTAAGATPPGLVRIETHSWGESSEPTGNLWITAPDGRTAVVPLSNAFRGTTGMGYREMGGSGHPRYWRYLYLDRQLYRPADSVRFWGIAQGREDIESPTEITVELVGSDYRTSSYQEAVLARTTVPVGASGTYTGSLSYEGASPGFYTVRSVLGDETLASKSVEIGDIVKPAYQLAMTPDRDAVFGGDQITLSIQAAFFEGSPVPGVGLIVEAEGQSMTAVTDDLGRAAVSYAVRDQSSSGSGYSWTSAFVRPSVAEEGDISGGASVITFPGELALDMKSASIGEVGSISGTVRAIDLTAPGAMTAGDYMTEVVPGRDVTASVTEVSYDRVETGEYYDFIDKVVRKQYRYDRVEHPAETLATVSDGDGLFAFELPLAEDLSYEVDVSVTDDAGRRATRRAYLGQGPGGAPSRQTGWEAERHGPFAEGDEVELRLVRGGEALPEGDRYVFLRARAGVRDHVVQSGPEYAFAFDEEHVPNIHVLGAAFNGSTYAEAPWSYNAILDSSTRELAIDIAPDRERYAPGDEVRLDVSTTGPDGAPAKAEVLLSGVDAAIHSMQGDDPGARFLSDLYAAVSSGVVRTYVSHQSPAGDRGAEGGGGNGGRGLFEDVALFETVTTDATGHAETSFVAPDNLTSWVINAVGVTDDLDGGHGVGEVPVGLPLFVDLTANESYLVDEEPVVRLRAFGEALSTGDPVSFELYSETLSEEPVEVAGQAFGGVDVQLPALPEGEHVVAVRASDGELEDVLERTIVAVPSRLAATESRSHLLGPGDVFDPGPSDSSVRLVVSDGNRGRYLPDLARLGSTRSDRLDAAVARHTAQLLEAEHFGTGVAATGDLSLAPYQTGEGGLALLPYGGPELSLSARTAAVAPESVGRQSLVQYFTTVVDTPGETRERVAVALHGLAALGEPVLPAVASLLGAGDLEPREELYLGIAAAMLGDRESADRAYRSLMEEYGEARGTAARLNVADDRDAIVEATALASVLAAALGDEMAPALYEYTVANPADDIVVALDQVDYLSRALPLMEAGPIQVAFTNLGEREQVTVGGTESLALSLTPEQLAELDLEIVDGQAAVVTTSLVPLDAQDVDVDPSVALSRVYSVEPAAPPADPESGEPEVPPAPVAATYTFEEGDLVRVSLSYELGETADDGCYQVSDLLPSGLRPVSRPRDARGYYGDESITYPYSVDGQRVSFCVYRGDVLPELSYLARVVTKGRYAAEPALIAAMKAPESRNLSAPGEIEIH